MTRYQSVLNDALGLCEEERELLIVRLSLSLEDGQAPVDEAESVASLQRLSSEAAADGDGDMDWPAAKREIFGDVANP
jgi:hypothetical protein